MAEKELAVCDECGSLFSKGSSQMMGLCPEDVYKRQRFCFEKELLKKDPLDRQGRILRMVYRNQDLTKAGKYLFPRLMQKFLVFTDRKGKTTLETMLNRWYICLLYTSATACMTATI